MGIFVIKLLAG